METPIQLILNGNVIKFSWPASSDLVKIDLKVPYALPAKASVGDVTISKQSINTYLCYLELHEFDCRESFSINFVVDKPTFFLFFMLNGRVQFFSPEQIEIARPIKGICYATFNQPGIYSANFEPGIHDLLYLAPNIEWLVTSTGTLSGLKPFVFAFTSGKSKFGTLPFYPISRKLYNDLKRLQTLKSESLIELEGLVHLSVSRIVVHYHELLVNDRNEKNPLAYSVLELMGKYFTDPQISIPWLAKKLYTTKSTLIRNFKTEFNITPAAYVLHLRMTLAQDLLLEGQKIEDVCYKVGYLDIHSFRVRYKATFGYSPRLASRLVRK